MSIGNTLKTFPFIKVNSKKQAPFCVDGRAGLVKNKKYGSYPQMLGGSFGFAVLDWALNHSNNILSNVIGKTFNRLKEEGYPLGVHTSTHAHEGKSDCGFADNLGVIIETLKDKSQEIWHILNSAAPGLDQESWDNLVDLVNQIDLSTLPSGEELIGKSKTQGAVLQILDGEHQEEVAIVNLQPKTTLDVDINQNHQAFNLDLWLVEEIADKMGWDVEKAKLLSLGLYVATEMVLVEKKGKTRLPILVRK